MNPKKFCNILLNDFLGVLNKHKIRVATCGISPEDFEVLAKMLYVGALNKNEFKSIVEKRVLEYKKGNQA